ncbi:MAG: hypothetical protein VB934_13765, partial [Polyangiaceae bacterium]
DQICQAATCNDAVKNSNETDVDCGGSSFNQGSMQPCLRCADGKVCVEVGGSDCESKVCTNGICAVPSCTDGVTNGVETDIDCGGANNCTRCENGDACAENSDCQVGSTCYLDECSTGIAPN